MAGIKGSDTRPEKLVRSQLHAAGFRFRLHPSELPGRPDIVLPRHRVAIFVHGCFWHRHSRCRLCYTPSSNSSFWLKKFAQNVERDKRKARSLRNAGWKVVTVWECEVRSRRFESIVSRVTRLSQKR